MGGRGSLSSNSHKMYNIETIKSEMRKYGVRVIGANNIDRKGLSVVVEALETIQFMQRKYGKHLDSIVIGVNRNSDFTYSDNYKVKTKDGKIKEYGRTLIIPKKTVKYGKADLEREVKYANKNNIVVAKNVRQMVVHEYGHAMHMALRRHDPKAYQELERKFNNLVKSPDSRVHLSQYASTKAYNGKISSHEYVAEAITHLVRNTKTRKGQDMIDLVNSYISRVPGVNFNNYGMKRNKPPKTIRRRPKRL